MLCSLLASPHLPLRIGFNNSVTSCEGLGVEGVYRHLQFWVTSGRTHFYLNIGDISLL